MNEEEREEKRLLWLDMIWYGGCVLMYLILILGLWLTVQALF